MREYNTTLKMDGILYVWHADRTNRVQCVIHVRLRSAHVNVTVNVIRKTNHENGTPKNTNTETKHQNLEKQKMTITASVVYDKFHIASIGYWRFVFM